VACSREDPNGPNIVFGYLLALLMLLVGWITLHTLVFAAFYAK